MQQRPQVSVCFFGEGAAAEGEFHESLNLAALWKLPVLFVCENNLYAMGTALARSEAETDIHLKARSYGLASAAVDGMDVLAVREAAHGGHRPRARRPRAVPARMPHLSAFGRIPCSTASCTATRPRSSAGRSATRSTCSSARRATWACSRTTHAPRCEAEVDAEVEAAVAFAEAGTWEPVDRSSRATSTRDAAGMSAATLTPTARRCARRCAQALARDPRVFLMGEDVGRYGGCYAVSKGLLEEFGEERIRDTPLSESAFVGAGIGAALGGMRPIVEIMTVNFSLLALDQIVNNAATLRHMSGGQFACRW